MLDLLFLISKNPCSAEDVSKMETLLTAAKVPI
jgi:hypothetical protein